MKKAVTIFLLVFVALAAAGCDVMDALKLTLPQKFAISVFFYNYRATLTERRRTAAARGARDAEAETVLDALDMLREQQEADRLLMTGWARSNTSMMDEAIRRRPEDWTYRSSRAALALQLNDMTGYEEQLRSAEQLAEEFRLNPRGTPGSWRPTSKPPSRGCARLTGIPARNARRSIRPRRAIHRTPETDGRGPIHARLD